MHIFRILLCVFILGSLAASLAMVSFKTKALVEPRSPLANNTQDIEEDFSAKADLRKTLQGMETMKASFTQSVMDVKGSILQQSKGRIALKKPQMLRWEVSEPEESLMIADGNTVFNIDPFVEQVTMISQKSLTNNNPLMLLISNEDSHWKSIEVSKQGDQYTIKSLATDSPITLVLLEFDKQSHLRSLISIDRQQQKNELIFADSEINQGLQADLFQYNIPENWAVDDQRQQ